MKLGWMVVNGPAELRAKACENLEWVADTYLSVSTPVQCAAARLLAAGDTVQRQIRERCAANLAFAGSCMLVVVITLLDRWTGPYLDFGIFYLLPVIICAWWYNFP